MPLPLLERTRRELKNPEREAILLAAVTTTERLHIEVERLLAIAYESVARDPQEATARNGTRVANHLCGAWGARPPSGLGITTS
jgi:hypothetical protein